MKKKMEENICKHLTKMSGLFNYTQLWCTFLEPKRVEYACRKSLANLGLDYIDLYLIHYPISLEYRSDEETQPKTADGTGLAVRYNSK